MDSMVNHYFVSRKHRPNDAYTPGGEAGKRPDHATVVYCNLIRRVYRTVPIIIGGIEASLRIMITGAIPSSVPFFWTVRRI